MSDEKIPAGVQPVMWRRRGKHKWFYRESPPNPQSGSGWLPLYDRSTRPAEPAPEVEEYGYLVVGDDWKKATLEWQHAKELTASIPSTIDPLVRLSALDAERAKAAAATARIVELEAVEKTLRWSVADSEASLSRTLQDRDEAVRVAFIAGRESIHGVDPAYHDAAWQAYRARAAWAAHQARLRADQRAGDGGEA